MEVKVKLEIKDQVLELTCEEVNLLRAKLDEIFGSNTIIPTTQPWQWPYLQYAKESTSTDDLPSIDKMYLKLDG